jgi:hypothetical protein
LEDVHAQANKEEAAVMREFAALRTDRIVQGKGRLEKMRRSVAATRRAFTEADRHSENQTAEDLMKFTLLFDSLAVRLEERGDPRLADVNAEVTAKTKRRNLAKLRLDAAGPRDQERLEIDRLEGVLALTTGELSRTRHELLKAQSHEEEGKRRPTTPPQSRSGLARLPPLRVPVTARG